MEEVKKLYKFAMMDDVTALFGHVSHNINNTLRVKDILGFVGSLRPGTKGFTRVKMNYSL